MDDFNQHCSFMQFTGELLATTELHSSIYHLQHNSGYNINIILYLLWLAKARYGRLTKRQFKVLEAQIAIWHKRVISELKYTHALVADHPDPIAVQLKYILQEEIAKAHLIEQKMLYETHLKTHLLCRTLHQQLIDACVSMIHYCEFKNDVLIEEDQFAFMTLFSFVFNHLAKSEVEKEIRLSFDRFKIPVKAPVQMMWKEF